MSNNKALNPRTARTPVGGEQQYVIAQGAPQPAGGKVVSGVWSARDQAGTAAGGAATGAGLARLRAAIRCISGRSAAWVSR